MYNVFLPVILRPVPSLKSAFAKHDIDFGMAGEGANFLSSVQGPLLELHAGMVTAEVSMKMDATQPEMDNWDFSYSQLLIDACISNNIPVFGHCLLWHVQQPYWLWPTLETLSMVDRYELLRKHIETSMFYYKDKCAGMDVVNEYGAVNEGTGWGYYLGPECVEYAFGVARLCKTGMKLFYNSFFNDRFDVDLAIKTLAYGDGIGVQLHTSTWADNTLKFSWIREMAQECRNWGKKMRLSEISVQKGENDTMYDVAQVYRDIVRIALENKDVINNFTTWGVKGTSWNGGYLLFDTQGNPLLQYYAVMEELAK